MEERAVLIYVHNVCTKFTKNRIVLFPSFNLFSVSFTTLLITNLEDRVMLLSLRIQWKKPKEIRKQFQSFGFTDKKKKPASRQKVTLKMQISGFSETKASV